MNTSKVWESVARAYAAYDSPFVPCREDCGFVEDAVAAWGKRSRRDRIQALILGVTPGIALMRWPAGTFVTGMDRSEAVVRAIWPGDLPGKRRAIVADWSRNPLGDKSFDVIVGDGVFNTCRFPNDMNELLRSVRAMLRDDGLLAVRIYSCPSSREAPDDLFAALLNGRGLPVDQFKLRLFLALQRSASEGVDLKEAHSVLLRYGVDGEVMAGKLGWAPDTIAPFEAWAQYGGMYSFPTLSEFHDRFSAEFVVTSMMFPSYPLGSLCPTVIMRPR